MMATSTSTPRTIQRAIMTGPFLRTPWTSAYRLLAGAVQLVHDPGNLVAELLQGSKQRDEIGRFAPLAEAEQPSPRYFELKGPVHLEEVGHHPCVDEVVRELPILALDVERAVEALGLELDVVQTPVVGQAREHVLAVARKVRAEGLDLRDGAREAIVGLGPIPLRVGRLLVVPVVELPHRHRLPRAPEHVLRAATVAFGEQSEGQPKATQGVGRRVLEAELPGHGGELLAPLLLQVVGEERAAGREQDDQDDQKEHHARAIGTPPPALKQAPQEVLPVPPPTKIAAPRAISMAGSR